MKKLFISADIEGVCGIADWRETELSDPQSAYFRSQMTREVRAACEGALEAGVQEIFVKDAHDSGRNLDPSALPENVRLMRAWTSNPYLMMAGLDASFDAAMFIGYHSGAGRDGNPLAHTMNTGNTRVLVNGCEASEFLINAYTAASFGVPVILVSGDEQLCRSVVGHNPHIKTVAVNEGLGGASTSIHPDLAARLIKRAAIEAVHDGPAGEFVFPPHFELEIHFKQHVSAYRGSFYPGAVQKGPLSVGYSCSKWLDALKFFYFVL